MSVFGFSTEQSSGGGGDFLPIVKYDARSGRMFRVDRSNDGSGWMTEQVDITRSFKGQFDLENLETGWIDFPPASAPVMSLVRLGDPLPHRPNEKARNGVRVMVKLTTECGGEKRIREIAGNAKVFLQGMEELYLAYKEGAAAHPGLLPVVTLKDTVPVKSGSGDKTSTNYKPVFEISSWAPRGDLVWAPKNGSPAPAATPAASQSGPPSTGSTQVSAPAAKQPEFADADDFG